MTDGHWFTGFTPTHRGEGRSGWAAETTVGGTFQYGDFVVTVQRDRACPSEAAYCGEVRVLTNHVCLLPPGHETPHLPCAKVLEVEGVRFISVRMERGHAGSRKALVIASGPPGLEFPS